MKKLLEKIRKILRDRRTRKLLTRTVSAFAALVVFVTTYALVLPAITMEIEADCGIEAHQHDASCYEDVLVCEEEESDGHHHDDSCYTSSTVLTCEIPEHVHDETCYDEEGNLICEQLEHTHDDSCYEEHRELTCGLEESDGHHHDSSCYEQVLVCGKEVHVHSEACYHNGDAEAEEADAMAVMSDAAYTGASARSADAAESEEFEEITYGNENAGAGEVSSDSISEENAAADYAGEASSETADSEINIAGAADTAGNAADDAYVPTLDPLTFEWILNSDTDAYYYHAEDDETIEDSSAITDWEKVDQDTELGRNDLLRVYLAYTIPAGSLNATNDTARYRLPSNIHLTDAQVKAINEIENGIAGQYVNHDNLEILDTENYHKYLGAEAVEGTRRPSDNIDEYLAERDNQEYISAVVKAENVYNDQNDYLGQDLIFTFTPYSVQKNQHEYDSSGQPTKAGETIKGWFTLDFNMEQVDWSEPKITTVERSEQTADVVFVAEGTDAQNNPVHEIHTELTLVEETRTETIVEDTASDEETEEETTDTSEAAQEETEQPDDAAADETAETAEPADENSEELPAEKEESSPEYKDGTLTSEGTGYKITLDYKADAQIPENAYLKVSEITRESDPEAYEACLKEAEKTIPTDNKTSVDDKASRFFDIEILVDEKVIPQTEEPEEKEDEQEAASTEIDQLDQEAETEAETGTEVETESEAEAMETVDKTVNTADSVETADSAETADPVETIDSAETTDSTETAENDLTENKKLQESQKQQENDLQENEVPEGSADAEITETITRKIEPAAPVSVNIQLFDTEISENVGNYDAEQYKVVHFAEEGTEEIKGVKAQEIQDVQEESASARTKEEASTVAPATEIQFDTENFSIYGVVYTVDFHWEVNGKIFKFTLKGGDSVSLCYLVEALRILEDEYSEKEDSIIVDNTTPDNTGTDARKVVVQFVKDIEKVEFSDESLVKVIPITEDVTAGELKKQLNLEIEYSAELTEEQINEMDAKQFTSPDWALMGLKHFDTEETLTVTMKDGAIWTIKVTDPVTDTPPNNMQQLQTVDTRSLGVKMWLFDYDLQGKLDHQDNKANQQHWNIPGTYDEANKYRSYGINSGSDLKFLGWGAGNSVKTYDSAGNTGFGINDFTGLDEGTTNRIRALQGIVKNELVGGYPQLQNGTSLAYLFDPTANTGDRNVYGGNTKESGNITGLFELNNEGYYIYDSDEHYAELGRNGNSYTNNFTVYTSTLAQTDKSGKNHNPVRAVGFFPFDSYAHVYNDLKYEDDYSHYDDSGTLYLNPDGDQGASGLNHHLGVGMEMSFIIPADGKTEDGDPIQFRFSGDDDMWVFIDNQLVLDIGGLHQPVDGVIDFSTGLATITGKATVSGHSDNTGSAAIGVIQNVTDNRGNDFEFYPALNMTGGDGKTHTMKIFYLERGGCDSNCMISFNLPLVKGKGNVNVAKYDSTSNPVAPLPGVKFGIYTDPQCTDLIEEVTSNSNGVLEFSDLGIKNDDQKYYIKETKSLPGYRPNDTVYTLKVKDNGASGYTFDVYVYNENGVYNDENEVETIGEQPAIPVIYNEEMKPIDLTVEKEWQKPTMDPFIPTEDDSLSATFKVQRYVRYEGVREVTETVDEGPDMTMRVHIWNPGTNSDSEVYEYDFKRNIANDVTFFWNYRNDYLNSNTRRHIKWNANDSWHDVNASGTQQLTIPSSGILDIYMRDDWIDWGGKRSSFTVTGTRGARKTTTTTSYEPVSTDWALDGSFNNSNDCPSLTLPDDKIDDEHPWMGKFSNLLLYKTEGDTTYYYKYYIIESDPIDEYETFYVDGEGNQIENPSSLATAESNTSDPQKIINRKLMDIPVEKTWPDYEDDEFTWTAKFQLDYRDVPLTGNPNDPTHDEENPPEATEWPVYEPAKYVTISKGDEEQKFFEDLPMYYTDEDGTTWRREYSVREIEYSVWRLDENRTKIQPPVVSKGTNGTTGFEYTLWYRQDAGEDYNGDGVINEADYVISVENKLAHREVSREIDININKVWPAGSTYSTSPDAKAVFKLKRYVVEEYRNYENVDDNASWVDITLITGDGNNQTLRVPQGQNMYIRGYLKGETKDQNITFSCNAGTEIPSYSYDNSESINQKAFSIGFTADTSKTIQLESGADYVSGGIRGFHLSDTNSMLPAEEDRHFLEEFELNSNNNWHTAFDDLPFVEVVNMHDGKTATTFVYSYYFEEVECVPESFYPTFTDSNGNVLLGDEDNRIIFDTGIKATNRPIGFDILKVDKNNIGTKLSGAKFKLRKLDEDEELHYPVPTNPGETYTGTEIGIEETAQGTGKAIFSQLIPGYYELTETLPPSGYVLLTDSVIYIKVEKTGEIKLLKKQVGDASTTFVEAEAGEMVGNTTLDSSLSTEGRTIAFTVRNEPGVALPNSGGPGTRVLYLFGFMLTGLASIGLVIKRRRRNKAY